LWAFVEQASARGLHQFGSNTRALDEVAARHRNARRAGPTPAQLHVKMHPTQPEAVYARMNASHPFPRAYPWGAGLETIGMTITIETILEECPEWFHSLELMPHVVTPGIKSHRALQRELRQLRLPDLHGKSVLDIGAYDGFFSFSAEKLGAKRVVALDHYVWSTDMVAYMADWRQSKRTGQLLPAPHNSRHWRPETLPGRKAFDLARRILGSKVEPVVGDFMTMDLAQLGHFDVVFFLGVLYHMEDLLGAVKRLRSVTCPGGLAIIETEAIEVLGAGGLPCCEFIPGQEMNHDASNWWTPNAAAVLGLCHAAGFCEAKVFKDHFGIGLPQALVRSLRSFATRSLKGQFGIPVLRYRAFAHAK
jgi:tRNA (mo5U34)-methyltransferase